MNSDYPLLPLDLWRRAMGFNPWHFWQWSGTQHPQNSNCDRITREYAWQDADRVGRSEIRDAIVAAEEKLFNFLGYWPAPRYSTATLQWPRVYDRNYTRYRNYDSLSRRISVQLPEGHVQAIGVETMTLLAKEDVAYSDEDGDLQNDTFTVNIELLDSSITADEIEIYFLETDYFYTEVTCERRRIQPVCVTIAEGTEGCATCRIATITGRAWLMAKPYLYEGYTPLTDGALGPASEGYFVSQVEVYRRYTSAGGTTVDTSQAVLIYDTHACPGWCVADGSTDPASYGQGIARVGIRNSELGIITPASAVYDSTTSTWSSGDCLDTCDMPDRVLVRYLAGYPLQANGEMDSKMQRAVAILAAAELTRPFCDGSHAGNRQYYDWSFDLSKATSEERVFMSSANLDCPFGTRRGHVYAWRMVQPMRLQAGIMAG